jgi:hypothetical protein
MSFTRFRGVSNIGDSTPTERVKTNLINYFNWGFLEIGAYTNVGIPKSGSYGGDESRLRPVNDPYKADGQTWEAFRKDWVWESGIQQQPTQPTQVSGVFVDSVFQATADGNHHIDYTNGQVVFNTAISTTSVVRAEYTHRWVHVYDGDDIPWIKNTQYESHRIDTDKFFNMASGDGSQLMQSRFQLPAVVVETIGGNYTPYQLGLGQYAHIEVILHIVTEDGNTGNKLADILAEQGAGEAGKTIFMFNPDLLAISGTFPLNWQGAIASGDKKTFPELVIPVEDGGFRWRKLRMHSSNKQKTNKISQNLYITPVRMTTEVVLSLI